MPPYKFQIACIVYLVKRIKRRPPYAPIQDSVASSCSAVSDKLHTLGVEKKQNKSRTQVGAVSY
jgi:hypothetical protein